MPRLSALNGMMIDQRNHRDAGQRGDQPPHCAPEQQKVDAVIGIEKRQKASLELAAHGNQKCGEGHGNQRENHQQKGDETLLYQAPGFRQFITAAKTVHPRNHDARSGPQRNDGSRGQQADGMLRGSLQIVECGSSPGRQNAPQRVSDLPQIRLAFAPTRQSRSDNQQDWEEGKNRGVGRRFGGGESIVHKGTPECGSQESEETQHGRLQLRAGSPLPQRRKLAGFLKRQSLGVGVHSYLTGAEAGSGAKWFAPELYFTFDYSAAGSSTGRSS